MSRIADDAVRGAHDKLKALSADAEARRLAFVRERALRDERTLLKESREAGLREGLQQGLQQGINQAQRDTARNLLRLTSLDDAAIAAATGLSAAEVAALRGQG